MLSSQYFCTYFPRTHHHTSLELTTTRVPPLGAMLGHLSHGLSGLSLSAQPKPTELEEAVKYGRCEKANPGRDGKPRHRYIHKGTIFITDETSKHEITSWRMESAGDNDEENEHADIRSEAGFGSHTVIVVDASGSMRKMDVNGYASRTAAVYDCLALDFVGPQTVDLPPGAGEAVVSLIEMSDTASVIFERLPLDNTLAEVLKSRGSMRARSHGNYVPALDLVEALLRPEAADGKQLFLLFLSDGAPSDHNERYCAHGIQVWQPDVQGGTFRSTGKSKLRTCVFGNSSQCRADVMETVRTDCCKRITRLGDLYGRDRMFVGTVAFGPPQEDYTVLREMAKQVPRGSFQKLGLSALGLKTAFSSLTNTLTSLRTDSGAPSLTLRSVLKEAAGQRGTHGWDVYLKEGDRRDGGNNMTAVSKQRFDLTSKRFVDVPFLTGSCGIAHSKNVFNEGAERVVYHCHEVDMAGHALGPKLIAKETKFQELMEDFNFHNTFCRVQGQAQVLADLFNRRTQRRPELSISFLECCVFEVRDDRWPNGVARILAEMELEGRWMKWNNNAGNVRSYPLKRRTPPSASGVSAVLDAIGEGEESDEEETVEALPLDGIRAEDVPQCFSHFTHTITNGTKLVCDLQGVWNPTDGFALTDPVIHRVRPYGMRRGNNGKTDKGLNGVQQFFSSHVCNNFCRNLGLEMPDLGDEERARVTHRFRTCVICFESALCLTAVPCGHKCICSGCLEKSSAQQSLTRCPLCRANVESWG